MTSLSLRAVRPSSTALRRAVGGLLVAASAALVLPVAQAQPTPATPAAADAGQRHHAGHRHHGHHGGPGSFAQGRHFERMLERIGATEAQRQQIRQIVQAAAPDLKAQREARRALHARARAVFTAPTIDANAAEQVRLQMMAQHDQASRRRLQMMLDVAQVLTPEQRAKVAERMERKGNRGQHRGGRGPAEGAPRS